MQFNVGNGSLWNGDCLELMRHIPDASVDMILCDLPYGTMDGIAKSETFSHGMKGKTGWDQALSPEDLFPHYERILRMNGACVVFGQEPYTSRLITNAHGNIPFSYRMVWFKDHFANALIAKKAPLSYFEDIIVFFKKYDTSGAHPLRDYTKRLFDFIGKDKRELFAEMGHQGVCHFMRHDTMQFTLCTETTYLQLCQMYGITALPWFKPYVELAALDDRFSRRFNLPDGKKFMSNVLQFSKDYDGFHPTQKPVGLFEHLIKTYTNPGDLVLDNCSGSGTTAVAAQQAGRRWLCIEKDPAYYLASCGRVWASIPLRLGISSAR